MPTKTNTSHFIAINPAVNPKISVILFPISEKFKLAPIEIKNIPNSKPLTERSENLGGLPPCWIV